MMNNRNWIIIYSMLCNPSICIHRHSSLEKVKRDFFQKQIRVKFDSTSSSARNCSSIEKTNEMSRMPGQEDMYCLQDSWGKLAIPENRKFKKRKSSFFHQRHALWTSLDIFVVTYRVTNFLPKLLNMLLFFYGKKLNFYLLNSPIFRCCRKTHRLRGHNPVRPREHL